MMLLFSIRTLLENVGWTVQYPGRRTATSRTVRPSTHIRSSIIGRVLLSPPAFSNAPYHSSPSASSVPPPSITTLESLPHAAQSSQPTRGSLSRRQRAPLSSPACAHTISALRRAYTTGASAVEAGVLPSPVAVPSSVAPLSTRKVRLERSHSDAERSSSPPGTSTVPPDSRSPQSSMARCSAAVALEPFAALYGGCETSHSLPSRQPSAVRPRAAPGTGCAR